MCAPVKQDLMQKDPFFFFKRLTKDIFCSHRGVWRLKATKGLQSNYLFSRTKTRAGQGVCSGISLSCLLLFLLCVTGLVSKFRHFFRQFFLFLLPLGSFVIQKVITRYLLKESTLTLLFSERNVPSVMLWEAQIFIASDSKSLRRPLWLGSWSHLTPCRDGREISEPGLRSLYQAASVYHNVLTGACLRGGLRPLQHDGI